VATIKEGKVVFFATWEGKNDKKDDSINFRFEASETEQGALAYIYALTNRTPLEMTVYIDNGGGEKEKINVGPCRFLHLNGKKEGDGIITFQSTLDDWQVSPAQQKKFKGTLLILKVMIVTANEEDEDENENEEGE
jgi:hypothetical protein